MSDSSLPRLEAQIRNVEVLDAFVLAKLPELLQKMEETAYALVRSGDTRASSLLFMAVAAAETLSLPTSRREANYTQPQSTHLGEGDMMLQLQS